MNIKSNTNFLKQLKSSTDFFTGTKASAFFVRLVESTIIVHVNFSITNLWILLTGFWNDGGVWEDTNTWID